MKNIFKVISLWLLFLICFNLSQATYLKAFAEEDDTNPQLKNICTEVRQLKITEEQLRELLSYGLSWEEAEYYYKLNEIVRQLEMKKIEIDLMDNFDEISDSDFQNNLSYYREQVLSGNEATLRKALRSLNSLFEGKGYADKLLKAFSNVTTCEVVFQDGAKVSYSVKPNSFDEKNISREVREVFINSEEEIEAFNKIDKGYEEALMEEGITYAYKNLASREGQWAFQSDLSYSKVYLYTEFILKEDKKSYITYARGGQSSYGIVNVANSTGAFISRDKSEGEKNPAEARNEVVFTVTAAFGAAFLILSMSINSGISWTQYIIFRLHEGEDLGKEAYGAKYTWHAAAYK